MEAGFVHLIASFCLVDSIGAGACGAPMEPAETLREDNQAARTRESRAVGRV